MYGLSVEQYRFFGENGYLRVEGLIGNEELQALDRHSMALACNEVDLIGLPVEARNRSKGRKRRRADGSTGGSTASAGVGAMFASPEGAGKESAPPP